MTIIKVIGYCSCCCIPLRKNLPPAVGTFRSTSASELRSHSSQASHSPKWNTAERWPVLSKARFLRGSLVSQALSINKDFIRHASWAEALPSPLHLPFTGVRLASQSQGYPSESASSPLYLLSPYPHIPMGNYRLDNPVCSENELQGKKEEEESVD